MRWIVVGLITGVVAWMVDFVLWSKVFTKGMESYATMPPDGQKIPMGPKIGASLALALVFGVVFAGLFDHFRPALWVAGPLGGMEFGSILWLSTIAFMCVGTSVWFDKARTLLNAEFWAWFVRLNVAGLVVALLLGSAPQP
ncbi:MAG TPA: hypothetical protein VN848_07105 [Gemmatimonadales bacterium]|nr:hypothetical protein [Gemmatimonadales bacterium]